MIRSVREWTHSPDKGSWGKELRDAEALFLCKKICYNGKNQLEAGHCSPTAQRWVARTMMQNFIFPPFITLSCLHSHSVTLPLVYHRSFEHHWGCREGAGPPSVGGQGTKRFLVNLWFLSFHKKGTASVGGMSPQKLKLF